MHLEYKLAILARHQQSVPCAHSCLAGQFEGIQAQVARSKGRFFQITGLSLSYHAHLSRHPAHPLFLPVHSIYDTGC